MVVGAGSLPAQATRTTAQVTVGSRNRDRFTAAAGYERRRGIDDEDDVRKVPARLAVASFLALVVATLPAAPAAATTIVRVTVSGTAPASAPDASVRLAPTVQVADADSVSWTVTNGSPRTVDVELSLRALARAGGEGAVEPGPLLADVAFERGHVTLDPGETATATVIRRDVADEVVAGLALVASSPTGEFDDLVGLVVAARAAPAEVDVVLERADGRLRGRVELATGRALVTDVRARLVTWPSRVVTERTVRDVVVLPPGRAVSLDLAGTAFVGPVDLEVVAGVPDHTVGDVARAWIVNRTAIRTLGSVVLLITLVSVGAAMWRRRLG